MMIPGSNLLNQALGLIAAQALTYKAFASRTTGVNGMLIPTYSTAVTVYGSIQPVPRNLYEVNGLDLQKQYYNIFVRQDVVDVSRDVAGDQFTFGDLTLQCMSATAWSAIDGWTQILCVVQ